jgi:large subunit ribosomal protein L25
LKDITNNPVSYQVIHLDFEELHKDVKVNVKVPIEMTGVVDCIGVKLGGTLRQVIRHVKVRCLPQDIPACFYLDVKNLDLRQSRRLEQLEIPPTVKPIANMKEVAVLIAKR